jgi:glycosyltransferase involved in cell wall biosynthesis
MLCLTKYTTEGPSSRYRIYQFEPFLAEAGIEVDVQPLHDRTYLAGRFRGDRAPAFYLIERIARRIAALFSARKYDLVFIQKEIFPYLPGVVESLLYRAGVKTVLDLDDAIFLFYERASSAMKRRLLSRKIPRVISKCGLVLAGNGYLESYARKFNDNVVLFPTVVDTGRFTPDPGRGAHRTPVVGWIGSPETVRFLDDIVPALESASRRVKFSLSLVGADGVSVNGVTVESKPWSEKDEADDLRRFDVGIMPLPDTEWSRGKCALKLLQYMSTGVPAISSSQGSATEIVADGANGFLADNPEDWTRRLTELLKDEHLRKKIGDNGREWVVNHYSLSNYGPRLGRYLRAVVEGERVQDA